MTRASGDHGTPALILGSLAPPSRRPAARELFHLREATQRGGQILARGAIVGSRAVRAGTCRRARRPPRGRRDGHAPLLDPRRQVVVGARQAARDRGCAAGATPEAATAVRVAALVARIPIRRGRAVGLHGRRDSAVGRGHQTVVAVIAQHGAVPIAKRRAIQPRAGSLPSFGARTTVGPSGAITALGGRAVAVLRYAVVVDGGNGGEPEEIALGDRVLQVLGGCLVLTLIAAVYL